MYEVMFLPRDDRLDERAHLGLRGRERPGAALLRLRRPVGGPVAVEVEALERRRDRDVHAVPVVDRPLREHAVEVALDVVRVARDDQARGSSGCGFQEPFGSRHAHEEHAPVAVDVLAVEPVLPAPRADTAARSSGGSGRRRARPPRRPGSRAGRRRTSRVSSGVATRSSLGVRGGGRAGGAPRSCP